MGVLRGSHRLLRLLEPYRVLVVKPYNKTPYELFRGRTSALSFMRPFGCHVTILNILDYLGKFDGKSDEGFFIGYSLNSKAFKVYNIRTRKVEENLHIRFLKDKPIITGDGPKWYRRKYWCSDAGKKEDEGVSKESRNDDQERPENSTQVVNNVGPGINTKLDMFSLGDNATLEATHADFFSDEIEVFRNKKDERGIVIRNKARLVTQGHTQEEGLTWMTSEELLEPGYETMAIVFIRTMVSQWNERLVLVYQEQKVVASDSRRLMDILLVGIICSLNILRKFSFTDVRTSSTLMDTEKPLLKDSDGDDVDVHLYKSMIGSLMYLTSSKSHLSDYARASLDRKSTTGGFQFLGCKLISWQCKKQTVVATPTVVNMWLLLVAVDKISKVVWLDLVIPIMEFVRGKAAD
ncbi:retrovirus-related pol polyprotein from transposon TNT 1-94 [Tanacetum coccineum]